LTFRKFWSNKTKENDIEGLISAKLNETNLLQIQNANKQSSELIQNFNSQFFNQNKEINSQILLIQNLLQDQGSKNILEIKSSQETLNKSILAALEQSLSMTKQELFSLREMTNNSLNEIRKTNQEKLTNIQTEIEKKLNDNLAQNLRSFETVTKNLTEMQSTATRMIDSTKSVDKLNSIFERTASKAFGDFGEKYLEITLEQHLTANSWKKQVTVAGSQDRIDFVIQVGEKVIGIDCKFPVTKYQDYLNAETSLKKQALNAFLTSVKLMANDISKYYKTGKIDAILMYFPSDGMYVEVANDNATVSLLNKLKITPTSPTTLFPLIILISEYQLKQRINENAQIIIDGLKGLKQNVLSFREEFRKLGDKLRQAQLNFDSADKSLDSMNKTVTKLESTGDESIPMIESASNNFNLIEDVQFNSNQDEIF
jgi:DNA anti-recombination protein RmuC